MEDDTVVACWRRAFVMQRHGEYFEKSLKPALDYAKARFDLSTFLMMPIFVF